MHRIYDGSGGGEGVARIGIAPHSAFVVHITRRAQVGKKRLLRKARNTYACTAPAGKALKRRGGWRERNERDARGCAPHLGYIRCDTAGLAAPRRSGSSCCSRGEGWWWWWWAAGGGGDGGEERGRGCAKGSCRRAGRFRLATQRPTAAHDATLRRAAWGMAVPVWRARPSDRR